MRTEREGGRELVLMAYFHDGIERLRLAWVGTLRWKVETYVLKCYLSVALLIIETFQFTVFLIQSFYLTI